MRLDGAHEASADAVAAGRVAQALAERFAPWLPATVDELHTRQIGWARAQAASLTEYFIQIGRLDPEERARRQLADPLTWRRPQRAGHAERPRRSGASSGGGLTWSSRRSS